MNTILDFLMDHVCRPLGWNSLAWTLYDIQMQRHMDKLGIPYASFSTVRAAAKWMVGQGVTSDAEVLVRAAESLKEPKP